MSRSGFVAIIGRPNAGKSTLLNELVGEKLALVSHKQNATRRTINAIVMHNDSQIIFVDTPGIHERERLLNQFMLKEVLKTVRDSDITIFLSPVVDTLNHYENFLKMGENRKHIVVITMIDKVDNGALLSKLEEFNKYKDKFIALLPISVKNKKTLNTLLDVIGNNLDESPFLYDTNMLTTTNSREIVREFILEAIFENTNKEIPYYCDVLIEKMDYKKDILKIKAKIIVEKDSQKIVVIGKDGSTIKRIGKSSRFKIEKLEEIKVYLELFVSVKAKWTQNKKELLSLGFIE